MSSVLNLSKATTLRTILAVVLALMLVGIGIGFYFGYSSLKVVAAKSSEVQAMANQSDQKLQELRNMEIALQKNAEAIENTEQIVAESQSYMYQNQIINDLSAFANQSDLELRSITFSGGLAEGEEQTVASDQEAPVTTVTPNLKSTMVTVELGGDNISYLSILQFVHLIEQNLTRMQISDLSLIGSSADQQGEGEKSQTLNIEVFIR